MNIKLTEKNSVLKTAGTFCEEDINVEVDDSLLGGGSSQEELITWTINFTSAGGYYGGGIQIISVKDWMDVNYKDYITFPSSSLLLDTDTSGTYTIQAPRGIYVKGEVDATGGDHSFTSTDYHTNVYRAPVFGDPAAVCTYTGSGTTTTLTVVIEDTD